MRRRAQGKTWFLGGLLLAGGLWTLEATASEIRFKTAQDCKDFMTRNPVGTWYKDTGNQCLACMKQDYKWFRVLDGMGGTCVDAPKPGRHRMVLVAISIASGTKAQICRATCDPHEQWDGTFGRASGDFSRYDQCGCTWVDTPPPK